MANNLNRKIEMGEIVIIDPKIIAEEYMHDTRFKVHGGFGMSSATVGTTITGVWLGDGNDEAYGGYDIDVALTEAYQKQYGKFGELDERIKRNDG